LSQDFTTEVAKAAIRAPLIHSAAIMNATGQTEAHVGIPAFISGDWNSQRDATFGDFKQHTDGVVLYIKAQTN
jgi:hypothetical protein